MATLEELTAQVQTLTERIGELESQQQSNQELKDSLPRLNKATSSRRHWIKMGAATAGLALLGTMSAPPQIIRAGDSDDPHPTPEPGGTTDQRPQFSPKADGSAISVAGTFMPSSINSSATTLICPSGSDLNKQLFRVNNYSNSSLGVPSNFRVAISALTSGAQTSANSGIKVSVYAASDEGYGLYALTGGNGSAIRAVATGTAEALYSSSVDDNCIEAYSTNEYGAVLSGGRGALFLESSGADPRITATTHYRGGLYVDSNGNLWYCVATGTPGTWRQVTGALSSGNFHALPRPDRFIDTRAAFNLVGPGGILGPVPTNTIRTYSMTGRNGSSGDPSLQIPNRATAILGNVTVVNPITAGYVTIWGSGVKPTTSTINYSAPGEVVGNNFTTALSSTGSLNVYAFAQTDVILDVVGYYL